jgi:catechol 2,3-dioxygenase-like lactoylglutathione lyase family enzyme
MGSTAPTAVMTTVRVRYMVNDLDSAVTFYTKYLGFQVKQQASPNFAMLSRGNLELVLSAPFGPGGAARPMPDGRKPEPGGWNRIIINVDDLAAEVARLRNSQLQFRNEIVKGRRDSLSFADCAAVDKSCPDSFRSHGVEALQSSRSPPTAPARRGGECATG